MSKELPREEMQQQLELASSKCGNLQKQLEIVKDKVRQSSTTNLISREPPDEKENKMKNGEILESQGETEVHNDYHQIMSLSSSSTEDVNEERDVNIIKVFYDRLGQMDYPTGHVELSDISSEDNDLDIDQLLSSVNFPTSNNEKAENEKRKEKRCDKKVEKTRKKKSKGKPLKAPLISPYETHLTKTSRQSPLKKENRKNKTNCKPVVEKSALGGGQKPISRGQTPKPETEKRKRRQASSVIGNIARNTSKQVFQEPIKRVMNMVRELRKTKSSTGAEKKDTFTDSRSLTRLHSDTTQGKVLGTRRSEHDTHGKSNAHDATNQFEEIKPKPEVKGKTAISSSKMQMKATKRESIPKRNLEIKANKAQVNITNEKGTSLSDLPKASAIKSQENSASVVRVDNKAEDSIPIQKTLPELKATSVNKMEKKIFPIMTDQKTKQGTITGVPRPKITETKVIPSNNLDHTKNGIVPHLKPVVEEKKKSEVRNKVNLFERSIPKEKVSTEILRKSVANDRGRSRATTMTLTRTNSRGTLYEDSCRAEREELERNQLVNNLPPVLPIIRGEAKEKDNIELSPLTISQIKRMKDNLMKFNAIPFIVGQSTTKSYHIGLNIQQTYSLFKQTPSITALKASKFADNDQQSIHSRARSTRTGYSGRSLSMGKGRDTCPACGPAPDPSPEQLADPWAVPQDDDGMVIRVCTCLPKRIISFDQVLNQLYFTDMNLIKLHPSLLPTKEGANEEAEDVEGRDKPSNLLHRGTNALYYTKLLRSIQNLKDNILG